MTWWTLFLLECLHYLFIYSIFYFIAWYVLYYMLPAKEKETSEKQKYFATIIFAFIIFTIFALSGIRKDNQFIIKKLNNLEYDTIGIEHDLYKIKNDLREIYNNTR